MTGASGKLEEEPQANLHDPAAGLAVDAAEGGRVGVRVDRILAGCSVGRMIEDIRRLDARLQVAGRIVSQLELLQQCRIGAEISRSTHVREDKRRIAQAVVRGAGERLWIEMPAPTPD